MGIAPSLSVIVMGVNEAESLPLQVGRTLTYLAEARQSGRLEDYELIYVDDGSQDDSVAVVRSYAANDERVRVLCHAQNRGMGAAIRTGYEAARMDWLCQLPADAQIPPQVFDDFLPLVGAADLIIGRYLARGDGPSRAFLTQGFRLAAWLLVGHPSDFTGTHLVRRSRVSEVRIASDSFFANIELPLLLMRRGVETRFVPIAPPEARRHGQSRVANWSRIRLVLREMLALRLRSLKGAMTSAGGRT